MERGNEKLIRVNLGSSIRIEHKRLSATNYPNKGKGRRKRPK